MNNSSVRYSECFKIKVVREYQSGRFDSLDAASRYYGINGKCTIGKWVKKYGNPANQRKVIRVETQDERNEIEYLKQRNAELERDIANYKIQEDVHKAYFKIVCREFGVKDPEALKKNIARKLSTNSSYQDHQENG